MSLLATKRARDMRRQPWQFGAVFVTIALGVMLFALSYDAYLNLESSYEGTYDRLGFADITVVGADERFVATARSIAGVEQVEERRQADLPMRIGSEVFSGRMIGMPATQPEINRIDITDGRYLDPGDPHGVVIETHLASDFDIGIGDRIDVIAGGDVVNVEVVGIAVSAEYIWPARSRQEIFPPPRTFGVLFAAEQLLARLPPSVGVDQVLVRYSPGVEVTEVDAAVTEAAFAAGAGDVVPRALQASNETLQLDVTGFQQLAVAFPAMFLLAAGLAALILLNRIVFQQRSQIGTLRASGMARRRLRSHYLSYGVIVGLAAAIVGALVGMALGWVATGAYTRALGIPDSVRRFHLVTPVVSLAFGVGTGALAALAPTRSAMRIAPAEAMRGEVPAVGGRVSLLERVLPPLRRVPVRWLMVLRGVGRNVRRSGSTIVGVLLALVLLMVSWGMIDSVRSLMRVQFDDVARQDLTVVAARPVDGSVVAEIARVDGVDAAEAVTTVQVTLSGAGGSYSTELSAFEPDTVMHGFPDGLGDGLTLGASLRDELGADVGDTVTVGVPGLQTSYAATVDGFVEEPLGTFAYTSRAGLAAGLGTATTAGAASSAAEPTLTTVMVRAAEGVDRDELAERLGALDSVAAVVDDRVLEDLVAEYLLFFYVFVGVMVLFGGIMAFALIFNTISVNVAERQGEYATMRANGLSLGRIARLMTVENLMLTALGVVPGLVAGQLAGEWFMAQYSSDLFRLDFRMRPISIVGCVAALFVVATLSLFPAIAAVRRLSVAQVVRERSL